MAQGRRSRTSRSSRPKRPLTKRPGFWILGLAVIIIIGFGAVVGREALNARTALNDAADRAGALQGQITTGDTEGARRSLAQLQASTETARSNTDGFLWNVGSKIPFVGSSVEAAQVVSRTLDDIATEGIPPVVEISSSLDADLFAPKEGRFDLAVLQKLAPSVSTASEVLTRNRNEILEIDPDDLLGPLKAPIAELEEKVTSAQFAASAAARTMRLAPTMLGADGDRTYLLIFQNNAEVRSTGGLPGAFAIVEASEGELEFVEQGSAASDIPQYDDPFVELTDEEAQVYGQLMAKDFRNVNFTPDFPRTAEFARAMVDDTYDVEVDGVLSIDPVALGLVLEGTGPVEAADGVELTSDNAADILLNGVYANFADPDDQDDFFADSAQRIFDAVTSGAGDSRKVVEQLVAAANEHRVLLWSADEAEQNQIAPTRISGTFPRKTKTPQVGVYMNDSTASKMQYYLETTYKAESVRCNSDGVQTLRLTTTYTSTAPADAAELPEYITGGGRAAPQGTMVLDTRYFAPAGGGFVSFAVNGKNRPNNGVTFKEHPTNFAAFSLEPGATVTIETTMQTAPDQRADAVLATTPGAQSAENGINVRSSC